jgi:hypothetical protein
MKNHYMKLKAPKTSSFSSASESMLYMLIELDELISQKAWFDRYTIYCQQKREETRGMYSRPAELDGCVKLLLEKGYVKLIPGEALERVVAHF